MFIYKLRSSKLSLLPSAGVQNICQWSAYYMCVIVGCTVPVMCTCESIVTCPVLYVCVYKGIMSSIFFLHKLHLNDVSINKCIVHFLTEDLITNH